MMRHMRWVAAVLVLIGCTSCASSSPDPSAAGRLAVVATTTQLADFAGVVGGDRVTAVSLLKPNVDAHEFDPSPGDVERIRRARVVVRNGFGLDAWVDRAIAASGTKAIVVDASTGVTPRVVDGQPDPHIWLDPRNAKAMTTTIAAALAQADAAGAADYARQRDAYANQLDVLDREIASQLDTVGSRQVVTNHDAFGYYLDRYHLDFVGSVIPSVDTQAELSAADLQRLVVAIKAAGVRVIFTEASLPPKTAEAVAREAGVRIVAGGLYGDSLGPSGSGADTYLTMMRHNTAVFVENLR